MKKTDEDCLGKKQENIGGDNSNKKKDDGKKSGILDMFKK